jgi:hypothetical protein
MARIDVRFSELFPPAIFAASRLFSVTDPAEAQLLEQKDADLDPVSVSNSLLQCRQFFATTFRLVGRLAF